jgi:hypothetical protein
MDDKPEYQKAIDEFVEVDKQYAELEELFMSGHILRDILVTKPPMDQAVEEFKLVIEEMKKLLEERNTKLTAAKNALRSVVQLGPSQWRGPDGSTTTMSYGPFVVSSVTRRFLDAKSLVALARERGFEQELMGLKSIDKDGREYTLVRTNVEAEYEGIVRWLKMRGMSDVLDGTYDEREGTPQVKGPKKVAFFGEKKDD